MLAITMKNSRKGQLNPVMSGIVIALASVLVVTAVSQHTLVSASDVSGSECTSSSSTIYSM